VDGLDLLGVEDALASQYITLRVKHIDREKLRNKIGGGKGALAKSAMSFVDASPKAALDMASPFIVSAAKDYGLDMDVVVSDVPPSKGGRAYSEFFPGFLMGAVLGGTSLLIWKAVARLVRR
jgi:hypothetical protein